MAPHGTVHAGGVTTAPAKNVRWRLRAISLPRTARYPLKVYALSRALYFAIALADVVVQHGALGHELRNWDGKWYVITATTGYPHAVWHEQTPLGFLPMYPALIWLVGAVLQCGQIVSGVIISLVGGAFTTVLVARLAERWWGEAASRRAILFFCLFPGSIVFSMVYSEGLMLALVAACVLALEDRRWTRAGLMAGLSTAVGPVALAAVPACAAVAGRFVWLAGWRDRRARRALAAPLLAPIGLIAFGIFLWFWTGDPLASYKTQGSSWGWKESSTPLAVPRQVILMVKQLFGFGGFHHPGIDLNVVAGVLGTVFLIYALWRLWKSRSRVSLGALVWTAGVAVLTTTSANTPPNARMLICAFPAVLVVGAETEGRRRRWLLGVTFVLTVAMSMVTFVGTGLRP